MMQQYFDVKRGLPRDTLLLFRPGDFFELFRIPGDQRNPHAGMSEPPRDFRPDASRRPGNHCCPAGEIELVPRFITHSQSRPLCASRRNSSRVFGSSRKTPRSADVIVFEFCFCTPRIIMQR